MPQAASPTAAARRLQTVRTFGRWDCINARQRERAKECRFAVCTFPSHVPSHPQKAAKVRGFSPTTSRLTAETDCLLEGTGFELSVPPKRRGRSEAHHMGFARLHVCEKATIDSSWTSRSRSRLVRNTLGAIPPQLSVCPSRIRSARNGILAKVAFPPFNE